MSGAYASYSLLDCVRGAGMSHLTSRPYASNS